MKQTICIIGGGASGMAAAIAAKSANPACQVFILEKQARVGKKILATGNGRCNIGNKGASVDHYYDHAGRNPQLVQTVLQAYSAASNVDFFASFGLMIKEEEQGKQYPFSNQAASVLDLLRLKLASLQVMIQTDTTVVDIIPQEKGFLVRTNRENYRCDKLILACGGVASPQLSNSLGIQKITDRLGLPSTKTFPALVQLKLDSPLPKALKGQKIEAVVGLWQNDQLLQQEKGEVLFTEYGISGPPVFQLSHLVGQNFAGNSIPQQVILDLLPMYQEQDIFLLLQKARQSIAGNLENFLLGLLPKRLGQQLLKICGMGSLSRLMEDLSDQELQMIAKKSKHLALPVSGTTGWQNAQVMAGGLKNDFFCPQTLEAKRLPGFFACGEILDVYGDCGGYNLTWAWSSGRLAGTCAAGGEYA